MKKCLNIEHVLFLGVILNWDHLENSIGFQATKLFAENGRMPAGVRMPLMSKLPGSAQSILTVSRNEIIISYLHHPRTGET